MKALITGITGQDGAYLSKLLLEKGYEVFGTTRNSTPDLSNLAYLGCEKRVKILQCDLLSADETRKILKEVQPNEIYNLAGQSSINRSFTEPAETITDNIISVLNILEYIRLSNPKIRLFHAASSEMYGNNTTMPITERSALDPSHPYGVSNASAFMMVKNYRETYKLFSASGILFNHESHLRKPEFFIRKLIRTAINISNGKDEYINVGQADNRRDFGYSPRYVEAMWLMLQQDTPDDYVICSGKQVSIREISEYVLKKFNVPLEKIKIDSSLFRSPNVTLISGDSSKAKNKLGWECEMSFFEVLDILIDEELKTNK